MSGNYSVCQARPVRFFLLRGYRQRKPDRSTCIITMPVQFEDTQAFVEWNEMMSRKYDSEAFHLRSNFLIRWIENRRVTAVLNFLQATAQDVVVEVGCGAGVVLEQIPAGRLVGMDLSGFILHKTKRRLAGKTADLLQANAESLPFADSQFNKLLCTEVIEHVQEPRNLAAELARVVQSDGAVVITIPNEGLIDRVKAIITRLGLARWLLQATDDEADDVYDSPEDANEWHLHQFDLELLREVTQGHLQISEIRAIPFAFLPLRYVVLFQKQPLGVSTV